MIYGITNNYISDAQLNDLDKIDEFFNIQDTQQLYNTNYDIKIISVNTCSFSYTEVRLQIIPKVSSITKSINIISNIFKKIIKIKKYFDCELNIITSKVYKQTQSIHIFGEVIVRVSQGE